MTINEFIEELKKINIIIDKTQLDQLNIYYQFLIEYNQKVNLTRITDEKDVYLKHFYDSITISKAIDLTKKLTLCDVGTGAGFPGVVLKIIFPNLKITLLDSLNKRIVFLNELIKKLNLTDIEAIHVRAEDYKKHQFDIVTTRAIAKLDGLCKISKHLIKKDGVIIAMKSSNIEEEINTSKNYITSNNLKIKEIVTFVLPKEKIERTLIIITFK